MLELKDLHATVEGTPILKGLTLSVGKGEVHAVMGPNGSGKSTLAKVICGHPDYEITGGDVLFEGESLLEMDPEERAQKGVFLSFQHPVEIPGVSTSVFLKAAMNAQRRSRGEPEIDAFDFLKKAKATLQAVGMPEALLHRSLNEGFSGGEKKRNEVFQMTMLEPRLAGIAQDLDGELQHAGAEGLDAFQPGCDVLDQQPGRGRRRLRAPGDVIQHRDVPFVTDAYNDVLRTLEESGFAFDVVVHGARVQGHSTEPSVLNALDWFAEAYEGPPMMDRDTLLAHPRMRDYVAHNGYDPVPALRSLQVPVLAVFGGADAIVPVERSAEAMRAAAGRAGAFGDDETGKVDGTDAREGVGQGARDRDGGIGEGGRGGKPISRGDIKANQPGHGLGAKAQSRQDGRHQAEGGDPFGDPLGAAGSHGGRSLP